MQAILGTRDFGNVDGFNVVAKMVADESDAPNSETYSPDQIAAWKQDKWHFVGIIVTVSRAGVELGEDSVYGLELGLPAGHNPLTEGDIDTFAHEYGHDLVNNAMEEAEQKLRELRS